MVGSPLWTGSSVLIIHHPGPRFRFIAPRASLQLWFYYRYQWGSVVLIFIINSQN